MKLSPIRSVSAKRRKRDRDYQRAREDVYRRAGGRCEVRVADDCTGRCEQVHHIAGRGGPNPHRQSNLIGCCHWCHELIHREVAWATKWGYLKTRIGGAA